MRKIDNEPAQGVGRQRLRSIVRKRAHALWNQTSATSATIMPGNLPQLSPMPYVGQIPGQLVYGRQAGCSPCYLKQLPSNVSEPHCPGICPTYPCPGLS